MDENSIGRRADVLFNREGMNCAQTVLLTMAGHFGVGDARLRDISAAFGGGLCGTHAWVCGAVSGALMVIGLQADDKKAVGREFLEWPKGKRGTLLCDRILDIDFSDEEQVKTEKEPKKLTVCTPLIRDVCLWLVRRFA